MAIHVFSEIAPIKKILLHRPGVELEHLSPHTLGKLLFDDIPFLDMAQREHDYFADVLRRRGAEVVYLEDLMAETLFQNPGLSEQFIDDFIREAGDAALFYKKPLRALLLAIEKPLDLVLKTMAGVNIKELPDSTRGPLVTRIRPASHFVLDPIPNLYFTRDPFASIGNGVSINRMFSATRRRETIYARYIFQYHFAFADSVRQYYSPDMPFHIEGGDILILNEQALAVGISQRTSAGAIEQLAKNIFSDKYSNFNTVIALDIPNYRAFMHLDTIFTQIDRDKFTIHSDAVSQSLGTYRLVKTGEDGSFKVDSGHETLKQMLGRVLDVGEVTLIKCGGDDFVASEREQWNDGANTLCLAPGLVAVYNRNSVTNRLLREAGITVLEMPSSELSRGRGGPRCMSMPLVRQWDAPRTEE